MAKITNLPKWFLDLSDNEKEAYVRKHYRGGIAQLWRGRGQAAQTPEPEVPQRPSRLGQSLMDSLFMDENEEIAPVIRRTNSLGLSQQAYDRAMMKFNLDSNFLHNYRRQPVVNPEYQRLEKDLVDKILKFSASTDALIRASSNFDHGDAEFDSVLANKPFESIKWVEKKIQARLDEKTPIDEKEAEYLTTQLALAVAETADSACYQNSKEWDYLINADPTDLATDNQKLAYPETKGHGDDLKRVLMADARLSQTILDNAMASDYFRSFALAHYINNNYLPIQEEKARLKADYEVKVQKLKDCVQGTLTCGVAPYGEALESIALHLADIRERLSVIEVAEERFAAKTA